MEKIKNFLKKSKIEYYENFDSYTLSAIRLGERISLIIFPHNTSELKKVLKFFSSLKILFKVFGNLSNVLFVEPISFPVIVTSKMESEIEKE